MSLSRFDEIAEFFDEVTGTILHRRLRRAAVAALRPQEGRRILDLGTGPGGLALDLAKREAAVTGLDGSEEMLDRAKDRLRGSEHGPRVRLVRGDAARLPFPDDSFDDIAGMLVLHLLDDPAPALSECRRVARPGARMAFVTQTDDFGPNADASAHGPLDELERDFLEGCAASAESHPRLDPRAWTAAFKAANLPDPTITLALPGIAWLLFTQTSGATP